MHLIKNSIEEHDKISVSVHGVCGYVKKPDQIVHLGISFGLNIDNLRSKPIGNELFSIELFVYMLVEMRVWRNIRFDQFAYETLVQV